MKLLRRAAGWATLAAALAIAAPAFAQTGGITGKATLKDGSPCVQCIVMLERREVNGVYKTKTNKNGHYVYIGLPVADYKITLEDPDGKPLFYVVKHIGLGQPTQVDFDLAKLLAKAQQQRQEQIAKNPELAQQQKERQEQAQKRKEEEKQFTNMKQLFDEGKAAMAQQNYKLAAENFQKALPLAKDKNVPTVLENLAVAYQKSNQNQQAVETYQKAIQLSPDDASLHNNLGSLYGQTGKLAEAQKEFEAAAKLDPVNAARYYYNIGVIMENAGKMDQALEAAEKVISIDPKNADAYYMKGQALMGQAKLSADGKIQAPAGTEEAFQKYLELAPDGPNAPAARAMLQTLEGHVQTTYKHKKG